MGLFTIGFAGHTAEKFFGELRAAGVRRVVDVRLNNTSQLAGFSKKQDLQYLLRALLDVDYIHLLELAPSKELLGAYQRHELDWAAYSVAYTDLIDRRRVHRLQELQELDDSCLLCSEKQPHHCHRRLLAEYLQRHRDGLAIRHLA